MRRAVKGVAHASGQPAGDGNPDTARCGAVRRLGGLDGCANHEHQRCWVPAVKGQFDDSLVFNDRADPGAADVHQRRCGFDSNRFLERTDLEGGIDRRGCADLEHDSGLHVGAEALQRNLEPVRTGREVRDQVRTVFICHNGARQSGSRLRCGDSDTREDGAAGVGDTAVQFGRGKLRPCGCGGAERGQKCCRHDERKRPSYDGHAGFLRNLNELSGLVVDRRRSMNIPPIPCQTRGEGARSRARSRAHGPEIFLVILAIAK